MYIKPVAIIPARPATYIETHHFYGTRLLAYKMSDVDSVDIDTWLDYDPARLLMERRREAEKVINGATDK